MSGKISDYLKANDNKLTALLKSEELDGAILNECLMEVVKRSNDWWCDLYLGYTLSCNDLNAIAYVFDGYWWCISPRYKGRGYRLSIDLKDDLK